MADNSTVEQKIKVNSESAKQNLEDLAKSLGIVKNQITRVTTSVKQGENGLEQTKKVITSITSAGQKVTTTLDGTNQVLKQTVTTSAKATSSFKKLHTTLSKLYFFWNMTSKIRQGMVNSVKNAVDYNETVNKFNNSMGIENIKKATEFQQELSHTWGVAQTEMMNYQANFKNIMSSLGSISSTTAEEISENLTKMSLDYSSLFNVDQDTAAQKIQSALTGQVKPVRADSGYDISESTLNATAQNIGLTRSVSQLNEVEKRLLRIISLNNQLRSTSAFRDFANTIDQPAAQLRILKNQLQETGMWIGQAILVPISKVLPYVVGFAMALKEVAKALAYFVGYKPVTTGLADVFKDVDDTTADISDNLGNATKKAKEFKNVLMGFDVLNVITTPDTSDSGSGADVGGIDSAILAAMKDYDSLLGDAKDKVNNIRDTIMSWLGFTYDAETGVYKLTDKWKALRGILIVIGALAGLLLIPKLIKWLINLRKPVEALTKPMSSLTEGVKNLLTSIGKAVQVVAVLGGIALVIWSFIELIKTVNESGMNLNEVLLLIGGALLSLSVAFGIIAASSKLLDWEGIAGIVVVLGGLVLILQSMSKLIKTISDSGLKLNDVVDAFVTILAGLAILMASVALLGPAMTAGLGPFLVIIVGISAILIVMSKTLPIILEAVSDFIENTAKALIDIIGAITDSIDTVIHAIGDVLPPIIKTLGEAFEKVFNSISNIINSVSNAITNFFNTILNFVQNIGPAIETSVNSILNAITRLINFVISGIEYLINRVVDGVNAAANTVNGIPGVDIQHKSYVTIPRFTGYASGGFPTMGEMFVAREAGPELVGTIGNNTAVMNNDQIVESVSQGVAQAVSQVMQGQGGNYNFYIDGQQITGVIQKRIARNNNIYGMA